MRRTETRLLYLGIPWSPVAGVQSLESSPRSPVPGAARCWSRDNSTGVIKAHHYQPGHVSPSHGQSESDSD